MAVAREVEDDRLALALLLAAQRLVDGGADRVGGLRRGHDALARANWTAASKVASCGYRHGLDHALVVELADERRHAVVAQAARVDAARA